MADYNGSKVRIPIAHVVCRLPTCIIPKAGVTPANAPVAARIQAVMPVWGTTIAHTALLSLHCIRFCTNKNQNIHVTICRCNLSSLGFRLNWYLTPYGMTRDLALMKCVKKGSRLT